MPKQHVKLLNQSIDMGNVAYEGLEHIAAVTTGLQDIVSEPNTSDRVKVMQIEKIAKAALYLAHDYMAFIDVEVEGLKKKLKGGEL